MSKIVFAGTSVTKGVGYSGVAATDTFAHKIGVANNYAGADIINAGVGGDTSSSLLSRLHTDVISYGPAVVVVEIGINDWAKGVGTETFRSNISAIFSDLIVAGVKTIAMSKLQRGSTADIAGQNNYWQVFENECAVRSINVIDLFREECAAYLYLTNSAFYANYADSLHFTPAGHQFVTDFCTRSTHSGWFI